MNQEELELLKQSVTLQKKTLRTQQFILGVFVVVVVCLAGACVVIFPKMMDLLKTLEDVLNNIQPTIEGLNNFDYSTLNQTMYELKDAISSLNNVLNIFH